LKSPEPLKRLNPSCRSKGNEFEVKVVRLYNGKALVLGIPVMPRIWISGGPPGTCTINGIISTSQIRAAGSQVWEVTEDDAIKRQQKKEIQNFISAPLRNANT